MKKEFSGLRTVIYKVNDLQKAKAWYSEVFNTPPYFDEPFYVGFEIAGYELGLQPYDGEIAKGDNIETYWGVEDINKSFTRLLELGATEVTKPMNVGGPIEVATVKDPWGNLIGIIYNPLFAVKGDE
jgi:predicted enzyme related to lactoylglutathione lyase